MAESLTKDTCDICGDKFSPFPVHVCFGEKGATLDKYLPRLSPIELAGAIAACREAGAQTAASAISKHISRLEADVEHYMGIAKLNRGTIIEMQRAKS